MVQLYPIPLIRIPKDVPLVFIYTACAVSIKRVPEGRPFASLTTDPIQSVSRRYDNSILKGKSLRSTVFTEGNTDRVKERQVHLPLVHDRRC